MVAAKGKKYLVLSFTVQNPGKADLPFDWGKIGFTVVGADTRCPGQAGGTPPRGWRPTAISPAAAHLPGRPLVEQAA